MNKQKTFAEWLRFIFQERREDCGPSYYWEVKAK